TPMTLRSRNVCFTCRWNSTKARSLKTSTSSRKPKSCASCARSRTGNAKWLASLPRKPVPSQERSRKVPEWNGPGILTRMKTSAPDDSRQLLLYPHIKRILVRRINSYPRRIRMQRIKQHIRRCRHERARHEQQRGTLRPEPFRADLTRLVEMIDPIFA